MSLVSYDTLRRVRERGQSPPVDMLSPNTEAAAPAEDHDTLEDLGSLEPQQKVQRMYTLCKQIVGMIDEKHQHVLEGRRTHTSKRQSLRLKAHVQPAGPSSSLPVIDPALKRLFAAFHELGQDLGYLPPSSRSLGTSNAAPLPQTLLVNGEDTPEHPSPATEHPSQADEVFEPTETHKSTAAQPNTSKDPPGPTGSEGATSLGDNEIWRSAASDADLPLLGEEPEPRTRGATPGGDDAATASPSVPGIVNEQVQNCHTADLQASMMETLEECATQCANFDTVGICRVKVDDLPSFALESGTLLDKSDIYLQNIKYSNEPGDIPRVDALPNTPQGKNARQNAQTSSTHYSLPTFTQGQGEKIWTAQELRDMFENVADKAGKQSWHYYIGPPTMLQDYTVLLDSGPRMNDALSGTIPGINQSYLYISDATFPTATAMHKEDGQWASVNLVRAGGPKIWLTVHVNDSEVLESKLRDRYPSAYGGCSQAVRHLNVLIPPSQLEEWKIGYTITVCNPSELVFTKENAYHQVLNPTNNFAEAVNFMFSTTPILPRSYIFCTSKQNCGLPRDDKFFLQKNSFRDQALCCTSGETDHEVEFRDNNGALVATKRKVSTKDKSKKTPSKRSKTSFTSVSRSARNLRSREVEDSSDECGNSDDAAWLARVKALDLRLQVDLSNGVSKSNKGVLMAISTMSKEVFGRCYNVVTAWRTQSCNTTPAFSIAKTVDVARRAAMFDSIITRASRHTDLGQCVSRMNAYYYAEAISALKGSRDRLSEDQLTTLLSASGEIDLTSPQKRKVLGNTITRRSKWLAICGTYGPGMLPLIPFRSNSLYHISSDICTKLSAQQITEFHQYLSKSDQLQGLVTRLAELGSLVARLLLNEREIEFQFEYENHHFPNSTLGCYPDLSGYSCEELFRLFEEAKYPVQNTLDATPCSVPGTLTPSLPIDPTEALQDIPCDGCARVQGCACIANLPRNAYRITSCSTRMDDQITNRTAIVAFGSSSGEIVFQAGQLIAEVVGELVPLDTVDDKSELLPIYAPRKSSEELRTVVYLRIQTRGNLMRLVNHDCRKPNAEMISMVVAGRLRLMLRAKVDIIAGMEVTADYPERHPNWKCTCDPRLLSYCGAVCLRLVGRQMNQDPWGGAHERKGEDEAAEMVV